jgi:hypothetical protein
MFYYIIPNGPWSYDPGQAPASPSWQPVPTGQLSLVDDHHADARQWRRRHILTATGNWPRYLASFVKPDLAISLKRG